MRAFEILYEALKPSEYRSVVKNWDKSKYEDVFKSGNWKTDRNAYRIYLPLQSSDESVVNIPNEIQNAVTEKGYEIQDYKKGLAKQKDGNRVMKIGKLLPDNLKQVFANDKQRQAQDEYMIVISRHPYDIAGMSTGRGWTSCLNLDGCNSRYIPIEVKEGTLVAYLTKTTDPDLKSPVARIAIKPFIEVLTKKIFFGAEDRVYGTDAPGFKETVSNWLDKINASRETNDMVSAVVSPEVYKDSQLEPKQVGKNPEIRKVYANPNNIRLIKNPSEQVQLAAVLSRGYAIKDIKNPSEKVQLAAVKNKPDALGYIKDPSERVQIAAVQEDGTTIRYIDNPSEKVQMAAANQDSYAMRYIENPSEKVQMAAVNEYSYAIEYIKNPSEKVQLAAVQRNGAAVEYIKNPSEKVQIAAVNQDGNTIQRIENPSEQVQLAAVLSHGYVIKTIYDKGIFPSEQVQIAAVNQDGNTIQHIENPSEKVQIAAVNQDGNTIQHIENPSEKVQLAAVNQDGNTIRRIENPSEQVQLAAVQENRYSVMFIKNPSERVQKLVRKTNNESK